MADPSPSQEMRAAANLMRERAALVPPSPWYSAIHDVTTRDGLDVIASSGLTVRAQYVASWHPLVALAVADWLEAAARDAGEHLISRTARKDRAALNPHRAEATIQPGSATGAASQSKGTAAPAGLPLSRWHGRTRVPQALRRRTIMAEAIPASAEAVAAAAEALAVHRWKSMGVASVECECAAILYGDEGLTQFPADEAFRRHLAEAVLEAAAPLIAAAAVEADRERRIEQNDPSAILIVKAVPEGFCGGWLENGEDWDGCLHDPHGTRHEALSCAEMRLAYKPAGES